MRHLLLSALLLTGLAVVEARQAPGPPPPTETASLLLDDFLAAYNAQDVDYFDRMLRRDAVVLDEDGHTMTGHERLMAAVRRRLSATPPPRLTAANVTGSNTTDVAWASMDYTFEQGPIVRKGFITLIFQNSEDGWRIAHWQFSVHTTPEP